MHKALNSIPSTAKKDDYILIIQVNNHHLPTHQEAQTDDLFVPINHYTMNISNHIRNTRHMSLLITPDIIPHLGL
jgi:hypothetical protein